MATITIQIWYTYERFFFANVWNQLIYKTTIVLSLCNNIISIWIESELLWTTFVSLKIHINFLFLPPCLLHFVLNLILSFQALFSVLSWEMQTTNLEPFWKVGSNNFIPKLTKYFGRQVTKNILNLWKQ